MERWRWNGMAQDVLERVVAGQTNYERGKLRYPSDLTDEEWALIGRT
jgi:hypothetical protein